MFDTYTSTRLHDDQTFYLVGRVIWFQRIKKKHTLIKNS
jgi:hypothetical protein